ncbi:SAS complex subunit [Elasticomyces elasticus]|nr:SAS complex subunit [Elasticomyces elasticus]
MAVTISSASPSTVFSPNRTPNRSPMEPNVANVVLGNLHIQPWYPSFYPEDMVGGRKVEWLYVCQWCFRYTHEMAKYSAHCKVCPLREDPPPGLVIYEKDDYIMHEIDGEEHKLYAQNLSLLSKLFLDTKSVFFDVSTFLYYPLIIKTDSHPYGQVVGFFSKEKMSWDNNNVACILVFPPWQRRGLGQILIAASYELGRREGRFGGPERPLSTLGRKGYISFWCAEVYRHLLRAPLKRTVTVKDISEATYIMQEDIVAALKEMDVLESRKTATGNIVVNKSKLRAWAEKHAVSKEPVVDTEAFLESEDEGSEMEE